jgi:CDP-paratose 2-epimerase
LALHLKQEFHSADVVALDNLSRRGSELNLERLRLGGVVFRHGDVRCPADLHAVGDFDLLIEAAAEPSVQAGMTGSPAPVLETNLQGAIHCMEAARRRRAALLLLSTSRIYPIDPLNAIPCVETSSRFEWKPPADAVGISSAGVAENFPLEGRRSFYGASKLAAELLLQEYAAGYQMRSLVNRCGLLTGPWQMARSDQGVVALWALRHVFGRPLKYIGFGGTGKQVRDCLHVDDLSRLIVLQIRRPEVWDGRVYNVGGGRESSVSLRELTDLCRAATGVELKIAGEPGTSAVDVRVFLTDSSRVRQEFGWRPDRSMAEVIADVVDWAKQNRAILEPIL